jgi:glucan 1,4-alpha-glucosidase
MSALLSVLTLLAATAVAGGGSAAAAASGPAASGAAASTAPGVSGAALDGPGATSYLDLGRKDCLGTARNTTSKVWFTVAGGMLSDVYYPTTDNTDNKTVQYVVTDGRTFTDLQARDMTYTARALDGTGMACQVTAASARHGYRLVTDFITDPGHDSVVMHTRYEPLAKAARSYHVYVRYNALINGTGGGGSQNGGAGSATIDPATTALVSYNTGTQSTTPQRDYQVPVYGTLVANRPFAAETSGFAGQPSDGLTQLDASHALTTSYQQAVNGNVTATAEVNPSRGGQFTLALGYGQTAAASVRAAVASATAPFRATYAAYRAGWMRYDETLRPPPARFPGTSAPRAAQLKAQYWTSANVIKATADKQFTGAVVSSLADPWGQATTANGASNGLPSVDVNYRVIFERDFSETFTGFLADGDAATARAMTRYIFAKVELPDGSFPRDALVNGATAPDNYVLEPDEQAFPLIMAWESGLGGDRHLWPGVRAAADFLVAHGPVYGDERWEDQAGYSPSNIATEIAGLTAAAAIARRNHDPERSLIYSATADYYQRNVAKWTVTTNGPYSGQPYFLRLSKTGDPNAPVVYNLGNGSVDADQRTVVDDGFLELARFGELPASSPLIANSLKVADSVLATGTPSGPGYHRYGTRYESENGANVAITGSTDGYGDCYAPAPMACPRTGRPWIPWFTGTGHVWPLLNGERGEQDLQTGNATGASAQLTTMANLAAGAGMIPEQDWEDADVPPSPYGTDPTTASIGFTDGQPTGSAGEITWAEAQFVRLAHDIEAGTLTDQPSVVRDRYVTHKPPAAAPLTVSAVPAGAGLTVTGTAAPGAAVVLAATLSPAGATDPGGTAHSAPVPTELVTARAGADGRYTATVPATAGSWVVTAATAAPAATGYAQTTVIAS